jgi:hypothetical protein
MQITPTCINDDDERASEGQSFGASIHLSFEVRRTVLNNNDPGGGKSTNDPPAALICLFLFFVTFQMQ